MDRGESAAADALGATGLANSLSGSVGLVLSVRREVVVTAGGEVLAFAPKERSVLAALATGAPGGLDVAEIVSLVWPDGAPDTARQAVRNYVMRIRRRAPDLIETSPTGYRIAPSVIVDGSGTGPIRPLNDLPESSDVEAHRARLSLQFTRDDDDRWERELDGGASGALLEQLEAAVAEEPYRERRWYLLARAHAALGDRRSALARCDDARRSLAEIGLRPDDRIRDLERRILDDDPALRTSSPVETSASGDTAGAPIVGIGHLTQQLLDAVTAGRHVAVVGAAGAGKTTLIDEVVARAGVSGWRTLSSRCSSEPSIPLEPFSELVQSLRERDAAAFDRRADRAGLGVLFPRLPPVDGVGARGRDRHAMFDDVVSLLVEPSAPTVIVVEDIHWASPSTLGLLSRLIDAAADVDPDTGANRAVVITTAREPIDTIVDRGVRVDIEPWTAEVVRSYVARFVGDGDGDGDGDTGYVDAVATWLHEQTSGHPLFVRELAVASISESPVGQPFTPPESVPELVVSAVSNRLDLVGRSTRSALEVAAMLGAEFGADDIVALVPAGLPRIADAIDQDIVVRSQGDVFRFRHELFRRVLLEQLAPGRRVELHDVIAAHLAQQPSEVRHAELAVHAAAAKNLDPHRALDALLRSAELHTRQVAWDEAAAQFGEALELIEVIDGRSVRWCRTAIRAGQCRIGAGSGGVELLITAARLAMDLGDQELTATAIAEMCRLGPASEAESVAPDVAAILDDALGSVTDPAALAQILGAAAMTYAVADPPRGELHFDQSIALIDRVGGEELRLEVLPLAIICLAGPEHLARREAIADELTLLAEASDDPMVAWGAHHLHMTARVERGDPSIRASLDGLHEYGERIGSRARQFEREYWSGAVALIDGDLERAEHHTNELSAYVGSIAASRVVAIQGGSLLALRLVDGRAGELLEGVQALADAQPDVGAWHAALAAVAIRAGDTALASTALSHLLDVDGRRLRNDSTYTAGLLCAAEAAAVVGTPEQVAWLDVRLGPLAGRWSFSGSGTFGPLDLARARLARVAGDETASVDLARGAHRQALAFGAPLFARIAEDFIG